MSVRNFFITTNVDGRETTDASGPRSKSGGFRTHIDIRSEGGIARALVVEGIALEDGRLRLEVWAGDDLVHTIEVQR